MSIVPYESVIRKWEKKKADAVVQSDRMMLAADHAPDRARFRARAARMAGCASRLEFAYCPDCGSLHIARTNLCRDRLCPVCSWRLALQRIGETINVMQQIYAAGFAGSAALLTLTQKNVALEDLAAELQRITAAWHTITKRRAVDRFVVGWARSLEITRGSEGTLHPHLHVLLLFRPGYQLEISQRAWSQLWGEALACDYTPIVDIRRPYVRNPDEYKTEWDRLTAATVEACKYALKADQLLSISPVELAAVGTALTGARLVGYGGIIKRTRQELHYKESDTAADVNDTTLECPKCGAAAVLMAYQWAESTYLLRPFQPPPPTDPRTT